MVRDYVTSLYLPAARASRLLAEEKAGTPFAAARELAAWKHRVSLAWAGVRIEHVEAEDGRRGPGDGLLIRASVVLGELTPDDVAAEIVSGPVDDDDEIIEPEVSAMSLDGAGRPGTPRYVGEPAWAGPGPSGTRYGWCPAIRCWPAARSWAWSPSRRRPPG